METLGIWLRRTREERGATPAQVEAATRIKPRVLDVLEAGNFSALPGGDMQARGFLRILARYLELPGDEVIARYEAEVYGVRYVPQMRQAANAAGALPQRTSTAQAASPAPVAAPPPSTPRRRWGTLETLLAGGLALVAVVGLLTGLSYLISRNASATDGRGSAATVMIELTEQAAAAVVAERAEENPQGAPDLVATEAALPTAESVGAEAATLPAPTIDTQGGITLTLLATEHVWVQVTSDDAIAFQGLLAPQQSLTWSALQRISVQTGNAGGLQATLNGQVLGALGQRGQVVLRTWGPAGEVETPPAEP